MVKFRAVVHDDESVLIKADRISGFSGGTGHARFLVVEKGFITVISDNLPLAPGKQLLDLSGYTVSPCFCDYHLHFSRASLNAVDAVAYAFRRSGIKEVYEGGDSGLSGIEARTVLKQRIAVRTSGCAIYKKGGYGKFIGKEVEGSEEAMLLIDDLCRKGVDYIKIIHSGIYQPETGQITAGGFQKAELSEIVRYAGAKGLAVYCHANGERAIGEAVGAGVSAIIHGLQVNDSSFHEMSEMKVAFIPTVNAFFRLQKLSSDKTAKMNIEKTADMHLAAVKRAFDKGVMVLPGSDSGPEFIPYGTAYIDELKLFRKAGVTIDDVLHAASSGSMKEGMQADFVAVKDLDARRVFFRGKEVAE